MRRADDALPHPVSPAAAAQPSNKTITVAGARQYSRDEWIADRRDVAHRLFLGSPATVAPWRLARQANGVEDMPMSNEDTRGHHYVRWPRAAGAYAN